MDPLIDDDILDGLIAAAAPCLGLTLEDSWRTGVRLHLGISMRHALAVAAIELPDELDPAPIFRA